MSSRNESGRRFAAAAACAFAARLPAVWPALALTWVVLSPMSSTAAEPPAPPAGSTASAASAVPAAAAVTGTVGMRERLALRPGFDLTVRLVDVSRADAPAVVLAEQVIPLGTRQLPVPFELAYDPSRIAPNHSYAVQARVEFQGQLAFITDQQVAVLTRGAPTHVELVVKRVPKKDRH
jgi:putative lipoprotein